MNEASAYLAEFLSDLHYGGQGHSINNCTLMHYDPCYKDVRKEGYFSACGSNACRKGGFCSCIETFRKRFVLQAQASLEKYVEHTVRVSSSYPYILDEEGQVNWSPVWTFPNALLFTMTTLTLIGNVSFKKRMSIIFSICRDFQEVRPHSIRIFLMIFAFLES